LPKTVSHRAPRSATTHAFPVDLVNELAALGGMSMKTAAEDDGPGLDNIGYALSIEAISRFDPSVAVVAVASNLAAAILAKHATPDQRERLVRPIARGEKGAVSFALTEPGAGSDAAGIKTRAVRDGDSWVLDGLETVDHRRLRRPGIHRVRQDPRRRRRR
jgi:butyryl-CoA dehydrogenase